MEKNLKVHYSFKDVWEVLQNQLKDEVQKYMSTKLDAYLKGEKNKEISLDYNLEKTKKSTYIWNFKLTVDWKSYMFHNKKESDDPRSLVADAFSNLKEQLSDKK